MLEVGSVIENKYRILRTINSKGRQPCYLAYDEAGNKLYIIHEFLVDKNCELQRKSIGYYLSTIKYINHPNIVPKLIDIIINDDSLYSIEEYWEGTPLSKIVEESGAQSVNYVVEWAIQLCNLLGYLHSKVPSLIFRDMNPDNVILKPDGNLMLLINFGTVISTRKLRYTVKTCDFKFKGAKGCTAPEQYSDENSADIRTDIYGLGATLYFIATGHNPGEPNCDMYTVLYRNPAIPERLIRIIKKCTMPSPEDRYQSCDELLCALGAKNTISAISGKIKRQAQK